MKRLIASFGVAFWLALVSMGSVAAQGRPESVPNNSVGITQASAHTAGPEASLVVELEDIIVTKKQLPEAGEP